MTRASDLAKLLGAGATILDGTTISTADNTTQLTLTSTDADASVGPVLDLRRDSSSPADGDAIGRIRYRFDNDNGDEETAIFLDGTLADASDGTEDASFKVQTKVAGTARNRIDITSSEVVLNEDSIDSDFRVESDGNANMLFVDGGNDRVGLGIAPSFNVQINKSSTNTTLTDLTDAQLVLSNTGSATTNQHVKLGFRFQDGVVNGQSMIAAVRENSSSRASSLGFYTGPASDGDPDEAMRILSGGQLVINSTTLPVVGTEYLGVNGGGASNGVAIAGTCQHNTGIPLYMTNISNTTNTYIARFATGSSGNTRGEIYFNGSALVYATSSDYRLKQNINYDFDATTKLKQLKPAEYRWIEHQKDDIGFLAHEVQDVFPNAVGGEKDETNADGSIKPQTYDPSKLVPLLTKALQEAMTRIETLETANTALEARITALETA